MKKSREAWRSWRNCKFFRITVRKRVIVSSSPRVVSSETCRARQVTHMRKGGWWGPGQPKGRHCAQKGSRSSVPANCCHVELCEQSCQIFLFSRESENISCKIFQFSNMATSFPFESLTQHAGRLTCPTGYQAECLRRSREVLLKCFQFTLHSAPCG